jgi:subtilisin family serine protease
MPAGSGKGSASTGKGAPSKLMTAKSTLKKGKGGRKPTPTSLAAEHRAGEFIAKLKPGAKGLGASKGLLSGAQGASSFNAVLGAVGASQAAMVHAAGVKNPKLSDYLGLDRTVRFRSDKSHQVVAKELVKGGQVEWVEPVLKVQAAAAPNDPYWKHQWHLHDLKVDEAWEITKGKGAVVAVVDTGVSFSEDGYAHLLPGKDFVDGDDDPQDENGHGTHVAGTIAQKTGNGIGTAGVAPEASILPVRVLDANGSGTNDSVAAGIVWAVDNGANIINLSLGRTPRSWPTPSPTPTTTTSPSWRPPATTASPTASATPPPCRPPSPWVRSTSRMPSPSTAIKATRSTSQRPAATPAST